MRLTVWGPWWVAMQACGAAGVAAASAAASAAGRRLEHSPSANDDDVSELHR